MTATRTGMKSSSGKISGKAKQPPSVGSPCSALDEVEQRQLRVGRRGGVLIALVDGQPLAARRPLGQAVAALVLADAGMPAYPGEGHVVTVAQAEQLFPEIEVRHRPAAAPPAQAAPAPHR